MAVGERNDARTVGVAPLRREDIELPQGYYRYTDAGKGVLHLPGDAIGGDYIVRVVSISEEASSLTAVTMTSTFGDPAVVGNPARTGAAGPSVQASATWGIDSTPRCRRSAYGTCWTSSRCLTPANWFGDYVLE